MKLYSEGKEYKLYQGDMLDMLEVVEPNSIDSIVTDPPYELNFMGKGWDNSGIAFQPSTWLRCLEVLKPGGYLLAFGGSRTYHRIACAIEDAGFEIRDTIMWLYGSGFPKSLNIGLALDKKNGVESKVVGYEKTTMPDFRDVGKKQKEISGIDKLTFGQIENSERKQQPIYEAQNEWEGWGSALKPSFEPIIVARKPFVGSLVDNIIKYGVGGLNIDECRVGNEERLQQQAGFIRRGRTDEEIFMGVDNNKPPEPYGTVNGRFPANTILTYDENNYEEVCGGFPNSGHSSGDSPYRYAGREYNNKDTSMFNGDKPQAPSNYNDEGSASRYFYNAKVSNKDEDVDSPTGRFPANTILTYDDGDYEEVCGGFPQSKGATSQNNYSNGHIYRGQILNESNTSLNGYREWYNDDGSASRYFYCAKASKKDRDEGLADFQEVVDCYRDVNAYSADTAFNRSANARKNIHPTVKPTELMQYLIRLVTPNGGTVLDPFNGSGSTGKAVMYENREKLKGYKYIGIELTDEYLPISKSRIEYAANPENSIAWEEVDEETNEVKKVSYKEVNLF